MPLTRVRGPRSSGRTRTGHARAAANGKSKGARTVPRPGQWHGSRRWRLIRPGPGTPLAWHALSAIAISVKKHKHLGRRECVPRGSETLARTPAATREGQSATLSSRILRYSLRAWSQAASAPARSFARMRSRTCLTGSWPRSPFARVPRSATRPAPTAAGYSRPRRGRTATRTATVSCQGRQASPPSSAAAGSGSLSVFSNSSSRPSSAAGGLSRRQAVVPRHCGLHPLGRMGEVQEIVEAVLYLESAGFVTGETLHVDGGAHVGHW
jgi:enoyl-ACP reductase-like protein